MRDDDWKLRLEAAIEASGRSRRAVSLSAGMGPGYVHSLLREGKEPTVGSLFAICRELGVSVTHILLGYDMSSEDEDLLRSFARLPAEQKEIVRAILRNFASSKA